MAEATSQLSILVKVRDEASAAMSRLSSETSSLGGSMGFLGDKAGMVAGALSAIAGAAFFGIAINQAQEAAKAWLQVQHILTGTGIVIGDIKKRAEEMAETSTFQGHEIGLVYARNISIFGDTAEAIKKTKLAMDLAAFSGQDLATVQKIISKASDENLMALRRLALELGVVVPQFDEHADKAVQFGIVLDAIAKKVKGFDEELLKANGLIQLKKQWNELLQLVGEVAFPILNDLLKNYIIPIIKYVKDWAEAHPDLFRNLVIVIGALTTLAIVLTPILIALPTLIALFQIATVVAGALVSPIGLIIGVVALLAYNVFALRDQWIAAWQIMKTNVEPIISTIQGWISNLVGMINSVIGGINQAVSIISRPIASAVGAVRGLFGFQEGGIGNFGAGTLAVLHGREAIVPLDRLAGAGIGGSTIQVFIQGDVFTDSDIAQRWGRALAQEIKYQLKL